ncbi:MAG: hypothetical protein ACREHC_00405 [Candidatus Levyibacteriota bacterium]
MKDSRLNSSLEKKAYHNIILAVLGAIILIIILVLFGTKLLIGFSLLTEGGKGNTTTPQTQKSNTYVAPPTLDPVVSATNSAQIAISGTSLADQKINLYINGNLVDNTIVQEDNNFNFPSVPLQNGQNSIKSIAVTKDNNKSNASNILSISLLNKPPELTIEQPQDGQGFDKNAGPVNIQGQTDPGSQVTINDFVGIVDDQGKFSYLYNLKDGDNDLKIVATDQAGNKTTKEIHIHSN